MNSEKYGRVIEEASMEAGGRKVLPCAAAFDISKKHGIPLRKIGDWCNENGIKIVRCQLGCFE